jgi:nondiscriminating aspartyl-tRNA synthetase
MERVLVSELARYTGQEVLVKGWVHQVRPLSKFAFVLLRDRTGIAQGIVFDPTLKASLPERETVVAVRGRVKAEKQAPRGIELEILAIDAISRPGIPVPFEVNRSMEKLNLKIDMILDHRAFSLRNPELGNVFRIQAEITRTFADYLRRQGFLEIHTSKIVGTGTEGGTNLFQMDYFEQKAYLAQSPQFYKQMLVGAGYERVFEVGFVYRAEDHATSRHINEYLSLDFEMGFIENEQDVIAVEKGFLRELFANLRTNCAEELAFYKKELPEVSDIPQVTLAEAREILRTDFGKTLAEDDDLDPEAERLLCEYSRKSRNSEFIFVTMYPTSVRPFYAMPDKDNPKLTRSFDLLYKGLEVTTGGQRMHDPKMLEDSIRSRGMVPQKFDSYLEIFRLGMPPHGGLAIGTERLTQQLLDLDNVRQACFFPRDRFRITP